MVSWNLKYRRTISTLQQDFRCKNVDIENSTLQRNFSNRYPGPRATSFLLLEVLGCWNRWFLYQQIFSKFSKDRPSKFQQQVCWASSSIVCWKCWNAGTDVFLYQQICNNLNWAVPANFSNRFAGPGAPSFFCWKRWEAGTNTGGFCISKFSENPALTAQHSALIAN